LVSLPEKERRPKVCPQGDQTWKSLRQRQKQLNTVWGEGKCPTKGKRKKKGSLEKRNNVWNRKKKKTISKRRNGLKKAEKRRDHVGAGSWERTRLPTTPSESGGEKTLRDSKKLNQFQVSNEGARVQNRRPVGKNDHPVKAPSIGGAPRRKPGGKPLKAGSPKENEKRELGRNKRKRPIIATKRKTRTPLLRREKTPSRGEVPAHRQEEKKRIRRMVFRKPTRARGKNICPKTTRKEEARPQLEKKRRSQEETAKKKFVKEEVVKVKGPRQEVPTKKRLVSQKEKKEL